MLVVYEGPSPARMLDGVGLAEKGEPIEVPDELGASLIVSDSWSEAKGASTTKPRKEAGADPAPPVKPKGE